MKIIDLQKSVVVGLDGSLERSLEVVEVTSDLDFVGAYKTGLTVTGKYGYGRVFREIERRANGKPIIHDGQKIGNDTLHTADRILRDVKDSGADATIIYPFSSPDVQVAYIETAQKLGLGIVVGGLMTHPRFLRSEGGYINDRAALQDIYLLSAQLGVTDFGLPATRRFQSSRIREMLRNRVESPIFYAIGIGSNQGGCASEMAEIFNGDNWHAIIASGICESRNPRKSAQDFFNQM